MEEINLRVVLFWIQIREIPPNLSSEENVRCITSKIEEVEEIEDPAKTRGFLKVKVAVDTEKPLTIGRWLLRENKNEMWLEVRYERLQDLCYRCGRIGHANTECTFDALRGGMAGYGDWTKVAQCKILQKDQDLWSLLWGT